MVKFKDHIMSVRNNQSGIASITITTVIIIIISLITVGFTLLMNRAQRQALDQQLSTQAFYAAESALSAKAEELKIQYESQGLDSSSNITSCNQTQPFTDAPEITSTCVLVNTTPDNLKFDSVSTASPTVVKSLKPASGTFNRLLITWEGIDSGVNQCGSYSSNITGINSVGPQHIGMVKLDLTNLSTGINRDALIDNTFSAILAPRNNNGGNINGTYGTNPTNQTPAFIGSCTASGVGSIPDTNLYSAKALIGLGGNQSGAYLLRLRGIYKPSKVMVYALDSNDNPVPLEGAQVLIDSTAKVNDVIRRIQARMPLSSSTPLGYALRTADDICKLLETEPASTTNLAPNAGCTN